MDYLIGNKSSFAIEFRLRQERYSHDLFGWIRLWLGGNYVGAFDKDICILSVSLRALDWFANENIDTDVFEGMDIESIYNQIMLEDRLDMGKYCFSPGGDTFDDFSIVAYSHNGFYKFIWKLYEKPFFDHSDYPTRLLSAKVPIKDLKNVVADFKKQINKLDKEIPISAT